MTSDTPTPTENLIDRDLLSRDLDRLAALLLPLFLAFLGTLRTFKPRLEWAGSPGKSPWEAFGIRPAEGLPSADDLRRVGESAGGAGW